MDIHAHFPTRNTLNFIGKILDSLGTSASVGATFSISKDNVCRCLTDTEQPQEGEQASAFHGRFHGCVTSADCCY